LQQRVQLEPGADARRLLLHCGVDRPKRGWRRSFRSNQSYVYVFVDPNTEAGVKAYSKKAYCKNSDNAFSYALSCTFLSWDRAPGEICV
jgi:hypothetical protein